MGGGPRNFPHVDDEVTVESRADNMGGVVQTPKSGESAERMQIHTSYLFYKYWRECRKGETQYTDGYGARNDKQWGKCVITRTVMEIFQSVLRDHKGLKWFLPNILPDGW